MSITKEIVQNVPVKDWYDLLLRKEKYSYYIDRPLERLIQDAQGELGELLIGIQNSDHENIKEEVADVIFNTCQVIQAVMKRGYISPEEFNHLGKDQKKKIFTRQPYIKTHQKLGSWEEETAMFKKLKEEAKRKAQQN